MKLLHILAVAVGGSLLALVVMLVFKAQASKEGQAPGMYAGQLSPCSSKPNCVRSEAGTPADKRVAPLPVATSPEAAWQQLAAAIESTGGVVVGRNDDYLAATYTSALFGFVDDLEARLDPAAGVIQLRSASRQGHSDLGANRTRVERLRQQYLTAGQGAR